MEDPAILLKYVVKMKFKYLFFFFNLHILYLGKKGNTLHSKSYPVYAMHHHNI